MSRRTGTAPDSGTTAYSEKQAVRVMWWTSCPLRCRRTVPSNIMKRGVSTPSQSTGRPTTQWWQWPQLGRKLRITWSPGLDRVTPGPTFSTTPAPSCPSTIGSGIVHSPIITW